MHKITINNNNNKVNVSKVEFQGKNFPPSGSCQSVVVYKDVLYSFGGWDPG